MKGLAIVISGHSGVGKSTVIDLVREALPDMQFSVSCTTRKPRSYEVDGVNYYFVTEEQFDKYIEEDAFVELLKQQIFICTMNCTTMTNEQIIKTILIEFTPILTRNDELQKELYSNGFINHIITSFDSYSETVKPVYMFCLSNILCTKQLPIASETLSQKKFMNSLYYEINFNPQHEIIINCGWVLINIFCVVDLSSIKKYLSVSTCDALYRLLTLSYGDSSPLIKYCLKVVKRILEAGELESYNSGVNCFVEMIEESNIPGLFDGMKNDYEHDLKIIKYIDQIEYFWYKNADSDDIDHMEE